MVLKSLLLQGFKSFPDRTEIRFVDGVTAIVGPNGSGKSNISDAIRWVLGEQSSRSLRGAKMEDVIFGGTARRGPVGFAEVSLILENESGRFRSDFTEIMITRRYYRSGESEYYMNKKHCRLRDIHELFMDTGLGRDGYSIIGQGRIDEVLSLKGEDRREMFEEAAGITKFRYRKEEAERKLRATEDNLVRIRDLFIELERQVGPLERQSEKARQYLALRDRLRVLEISLWLLALERIQQDGKKNKQDAAICASQLAQAHGAQNAYYEQSEQLSAALRTVEIEAEELRRQLRDAEANAAEQASRCAVLSANIKNNENNIERAGQEQAQRQEQAAALSAQTAARESRIQELGRTYEVLNSSLSSAEAQAEGLRQRGTALAERARCIREKITQATEERFSIELRRTAAETDLRSMDERQGTIGGDVLRAGERLKAEEARQNELQNELDGCLETLAGAKNKLAGVSLKADSRRKKADDLAKAVQDASAALTDCRNRVRMLRDMQKEYEGFSRSVKSVMTAAERGTLTGVHGPVSSLITVDTQYLTAIDTALGAAASNIVVDRAADGKRAIEYLKRSDGGRATFLPMDTIKPQSLRENGLESHPGCHGTADTLVQAHGQYQNIVKNLLARTVIADHMDAALAIARAHGNRFRIVTLDGQILQAGGAMTGGSVSKGTGALARAGKLRELEERQKRLEAEKETVEKAFAAAKSELAALDYDVKAIEAERARAQEDEARLTALVTEHGALVESLRTQYEGLALERDNLEEAKSGCRRTVEEAAAALRECQQGLELLNSQLSGFEEESRQLAEQQDAAASEIAALHTSIAENRTEASASQEALEELRRLRADMDAGVTGAQNEIERFRQEIGQLRQELADTERQQAESAGAAEGFRSGIAEKGQERMRLEGQKNNADRQAQSKNDEILNLERESARLENQAAQLQNEESQILDKMWEHYELTPTPAAEVAVPLEEPAQAERDARELRDKMKALGHINLDAIEEYQKVLERYEFLNEQKTDLEKAQSELYKVIEQLTVNMKEIFASEFAKLNGYFGETFREIFGGGHAELQLADTSDILNCGIDIRVSPPGKAVKTITLLSGGEKAFVAIALHFAILKLRPTPFCVLDEIEAALDDVNVSRFAKYIRRLSGETQFIVITHRRGTMEEADMLYGVTMQEQGVSRLLMLNLAEAEKQLGKEMR